MKYYNGDKREGSAIIKLYRSQKKSSKNLKCEKKHNKMMNNYLKDNEYESTTYYALLARYLHKRRVKTMKHNLQGGEANGKEKLLSTNFLIPEL